ncbi:hypothetical protein [Streptomyces sp. NPDC001978]|uniref:hypothetical protein n=1 Tax=Streptomyces sp. NPDC001978 TaxID=3364627 RepID=UPI003691CFB2
MSTPGEHTPDGELAVAHDSLADRYNHCVDSSDTSALHDERTEADLRVLEEALHQPEVAILVGLVRYARSFDLTDQEARAELEAAAHALLPLYRQSPEIVPDFVRDFLASWLAEALAEAYEESGEPDILRELVVVGRRLVTATQDAEPIQHGYWLGMLGLHLGRLFDVTGELAVLDEAIEAMAVGAASSPGREARAALLGERGRFLGLRHDESGDPEDLRSGIALLREAVDLAEQPEHRAQHLYNLGNSLVRAARLDGGPDFWSAAVESYRRALPAIEDERRATCTAALVSALMEAGKRFGRDELMTEALGHARAAVGEAEAWAEVQLWEALYGLLGHSWIPPDLCGELLPMARELAARPADDLTRSVRFDRLGRLLVKAAELTDDDAGLLTAAVEAGRSAVVLAGPDSPRLNYLEANLATALRLAGTRHSSPELLGEAVTTMRTALAHTSPKNPDLASMRGDLSATLLAVCQSLDDESVLEEATEHAQAAVEGARDADGLRTHLPNLVLALHERAMRSGDPGLVDAAAVRYRQLLALPYPPRRRASVLLNFATLLQHKAEFEDGAVTTVKEALGLTSEALAILPAGQDARQLLLALHGALHAMLLDNDDDDDEVGRLTRSIEVWENVLAEAAEEAWTALAALPLPGLRDAHMSRFEATHDPADLERAVDYAHRAVIATQEGDPERPAALSRLGVILRSRFALSHDRADLDEAVRSGAAGLRLARSDDPRLSGWQSHQSANHRERFHDFGDPDDLRAATELGRQAVRSVPPGSPDWLALLHLGAALLEQYENSGALADLNKAIEVQRAAYEAVTGEAAGNDAGDTTVAAVLNNTATALLRRYERLDIPSDLDEAIGYLAQLLDSTPDRHPRRASRLVHTADALRERYQHSMEPDDLAQAIALAQEALDRSEPGSEAYCLSLASLLGAHLVGYADNEDDAEFDRVLALGLRASREFRSRGPSWMSLVHITGYCLYTRWRKHDDPTDLDLGIELLRAGSDPSVMSGRQASVPSDILGRALAQRADLNGSADDRRDASATFRRIAEQTDADATTRYDAARLWAATAPEGSEDQFEASRQMLALLPLAAWRGVPRTVQETWLSDHGDIGAIAAVLALNADRPDLAVEFLEQGRAILWAQLLETRTDLARLAEVDPALARRMDEVRAELDQLAVDEAETLANAPETWDPETEVMDAIMTAQSLAREEDLDGAIAALAAIDDDDPWSIAAAASGIGALLLRKGDHEAAFAAFQRAAEGRGPLAAAAANAIGDRYAQEGDFPAAKAAYERAIQTDDDSDATPEAIERIRGLPLLESRSTGVYLAVDHLLASGDHTSMAASAYHLAQEGEFTEARRLLERAIEGAPDDLVGESSAVLGLLRLRDGDLLGARTAWETATTVAEPAQSALAAIWLADLLAEEFTVPEALATYRALATAQPTAAESATALARIAALTPPPPVSDPPPLYDFGRWVAHNEPREHALATLTQMIEEGDPRSRTQLYLVEVLQDEDLDRAQTALRRAIAWATPAETALVSFCRGTLRAQRGDRTGAEAAYESACDQATRTGDAELTALAAVRLSEVLKASGDIPAAIAALEKAVRAGHRHHSPAAGFDLALLLSRSGDVPASHAAYRQVIDSGHPHTMPKAAVNLGSDLLRSGRYAEARTVLLYAANGPLPDAADRARRLLADIPG